MLVSPRGQRSTRRLGAILFALALVISSAVAYADASFRQSSGSVASFESVGEASSLTPYVPAALFDPWAERAGYNATDVLDATGVTPATGVVPVEVTLSPSSDELYVPRESGAAPLSNSQIASVFGPTGPEYGGLESYFQGHGLTIVQSSSDRLSMLVSGTAQEVGSAFGTQLETGTVAGHSLEFPEVAPSLPAPYENLVDAVSGLSTGASHFTVPFAKTPAPFAQPDQGSPSAITPNDVHVIYGLNDLYNYSGSTHWATGQGIAVILWGSGYAPGDISTFFSQIYPSDFPQPIIAPYPVDGAPSPAASAVDDPSNSTQEMTLDIEWSASEAPGATIDAVYAPDGPASEGYSPNDPDMEAAINEAVSSIPGVSVISMSFGSSDGGDPSFQVALSQDFGVAAQKDITVLAASGDNGGTLKGQPGCSGGPSPQFPAASPLVLAVGGTAPTLSQNAFGTVTGLSSEPAWDDSGGGYSTDYAAPSWQEVGSARAPILAHGGDRGIPDVAGPAAENLFYFNGGLDYGSGTSFATPMWAGLVAEMNALRGAPLGFVDSRIYELGSEQASSGEEGLEDITDGSTCLATASSGWDAATGWGSPRAGPLYEHISGTFVDVAINSSVSSVAPGGSVTVDVGVTNHTSHHPISSLSVDFVMTGSFPGPCTGTLASVSNATTDSVGATNVTMTVPSCYLGSDVTISATVDSGGYNGGNSTSVGVNLLGLAGLIALSETFPYNVLLFAAIMAVAVGIGLWFGRRRSSHPRAVRPPSPPSGASGLSSTAPAPAPAAPPRLSTASPPPASAGPPAVRGPPSTTPPPTPQVPPVPPTESPAVPETPGPAPESSGT